MGRADMNGALISKIDVEVELKDSHHSHNAATKYENGLMTAADKAKLDGIEEGANNTVVDSELNTTSTNPVQNKVTSDNLAAVMGKLNELEHRVDVIVDDVNVVVNHGNVFKDVHITSVIKPPNNFTQNTGWFSITNIPAVVKHSVFANAFYFSNTFATNEYLGQDLKPSDINDGNYILKFKAKNNYSGQVKAFVFGYPSSSNSNGTLLDNKTMTISICETFEEHEFEMSITNVTDYNHIRIYMQFSQVLELFISEILLVKSDSIHTDFSYIDKNLKRLDSINGVNGIFLNAGDSIAYGTGNNGKGYIYEITENVINIAVNGSTIAKVSGRTNILEQIQCNTKTFDRIILDGGFNDYANGVELGTVPIEIASGNINGTFAEALSATFYYLLTNYPTKDKYFVIPHRINRTDNQAINGKTFSDFVEVIKQICRVYGIELINCFDECSLRTILQEHKALTLNGDGIHPLKSGYTLYKSVLKSKIY